MASSSNHHQGSKRDHCYFCEAYGGIQEHHIIPDRFDGPDSEWNLVSVCRRCHNKLERLYDSSFYEWFGIEDQAGKRRFHRTCGRRDCEQQSEVCLEYPNGAELTFCTGCALQIAGKWSKSRRVQTKGRSHIDIVRNRAVAIADDSPLKEAA